MADVVDGKLILGRINGIYGVHGWVKVYSHTVPIENIFRYQPWFLRGKDGVWREVKVLDHRPHMGGKALVAKLEGVRDREQARALMGCDIGIDRDQLPDSDDGYYWVDLIGCEVIDQHGDSLGKVVGMIETGGHDVMRVRGEAGQHLIPLVEGHFVSRVDLAARRIHVDWDGEAD